MTTRLVDRVELAFWHRQRGAEPGLFQQDTLWTIGDESGAPVGSVFVDGELFDRPDYWVREADGTPAIGLGHADGMLSTFSDPSHRIVWGDGSPVGLFGDTYVQWQGRAVAKWLVKVTVSGFTVSLDGAWLWDPSDAPVADVGHVEVDGGRYLALRRNEDLDECLQWAALALPLAAYERYRQELAAANHRRHRRHHRH